MQYIFIDLKLIIGIILIVSLPGGAKESAAAPVASKPAKAGQPKKTASKFVDVELTSMRKTIAKRLTQSKVNANHTSGVTLLLITVLVFFRQRFLILMAALTAIFLRC